MLPESFVMVVILYGVIGSIIIILPSYGLYLLYKVLFEKNITCYIVEKVKDQYREVGKKRVGYHKTNFNWKKFNYTIILKNVIYLDKRNRPVLFYEKNHPLPIDLPKPEKSKLPSADFMQKYMKSYAYGRLLSGSKETLLTATTIILVIALVVVVGIAFYFYNVSQERLLELAQRGLLP